MSDQTQTPVQEETKKAAPEFMIMPKADLVKISEYLGTKSYFEVAELMAGLSRAQSVIIKNEDAVADENFGVAEELPETVAAPKGKKK